MPNLYNIACIYGIIHLRWYDYNNSWCTKDLLSKNSSYAGKLNPGYQLIWSARISKIYNEYQLKPRLNAAICRLRFVEYVIE
jgi:hypothetical protein